MSMARIFTALLLTAALVAPASSATLLLPVNHPDALDPWGLNPSTMDKQSGSASADLALEVARQALTLSAAGDVDLDGVDDLIVQSVDLQNGFTLVEAVSGAGLGEVDPESALDETIWRVAPNQGSVLQLVGDLDGDAVADLVITQSIGQGTYEAQGAAEASYATAQAQGAVLFQALTGASASGSFGVELATSLESQTAGIASTGLQKVTETTGAVQATGTDALHQIEQKVETYQASLLTELPLHALTSVEADVILTVLDASGHVRGEILLEEPGVNPLLVAAPDLDLDGLSDTVLMEVQKLNPSQQASTIVPTISAYVGSTVELAWTVDMDPFAGLPLLIPNVGDLNADGHAELAFHAIESVPGSDPSGTVLSILDGASGEVLAQREVAEGLLIAAPFDAAASAAVSAAASASSGEANLLLLEGTAQAITEVAVANADLDAIWSIEIPENAAPINLVTDEFTGATEGLSDLTGDGVPDLAIASGFLSDPLTGQLLAKATAEAELVLEVYSGVDGELAWSETIDSAIAVEVVQNAQTNAASRIAILIGEGASVLENGLHTADELSLLVLRARDGAGIYQLPLFQPGVVNDLGEEVAFAADVAAAGDLDADGAVDLVVRVEAVLEGAGSVDIVWVQGQAVAATEQALDQIYAISGSTGEVFTTQMETSAEAKANSSADLDAAVAPGSVQRMEAYGSTDASGEVETPGVGILSVLALIGAAMVLVRRRMQ